MLNITLWKYAKYSFSVGSVVYVCTGKKIVDDALHFVVTQYLTIRNSSTLSKAQRQLRIDS